MGETRDELRLVVDDATQLAYVQGYVEGYDSAVQDVLATLAGGCRQARTAWWRPVWPRRPTV